MTGTDIAAPFRGAYFSRAQALQAVAVLTGRPSVQAAAETLTRAHSMAEIPVMYASRGDMALIPRAHGRDHSMGLVGLSGVSLVIALRNGTGEIPLERACQAWRV